MVGCRGIFIAVAAVALAIPALAEKFHVTVTATRSAASTNISAGSHA